VSRATRPRLALVTGLGVAVVAAMPPARAAVEPGGARRVKAVAFAPLFDARTRFKARTTAELRFRATDAFTGVAVRPKDISLSLRHGAAGTSIPLPVIPVKKGVFAVTFRPDGPGQYWITASIRGAAPGSIPEVHLGVVGLAEGLVEVPPEEDPGVKGKTQKQGPRRR
jgi:hypothetical protein